MDILHAIGNTSMVRLRKVVPPDCADIFVKLEWENPTGSMKDRMAQAVISRAEEDGRLKPGDTVVEYTGGSTGASLALVCAAKGYRIQDRQLRCVQPGEAGSHGGARRGADARPKRGRQVHEEAVPGHDRGRPRVEPGASHRTGSTSSATTTASRATPRWARRSGVKRTGADRRLRSLRGYGGFLARSRHGAEATRTEHPRSSPSNPRNPRYCWEVRPELTRSRESGLATRLRSGSRLSWTRSCRSVRTTRRKWRGASRGRRPSSRERRPEQTSSPRFRWQGGWGQMPRSSRSWSTPDSST